MNSRPPKKAGLENTRLSAFQKGTVKEAVRTSACKVLLTLALRLSVEMGVRAKVEFGMQSL